jgi:hypothetical protein
MDTRDPRQAYRVLAPATALLSLWSPRRTESRSSMSVQRSAPLVDDPARPISRLLVWVVEFVLAIVLLPPLLAAALMVGIYAGGEWAALRIHDALHPDEPRLGRVMWDRLGSRTPAPHGPLAAAAVPQGVVSPTRPQRGETRHNVSRPPSVWI